MNKLFISTSIPYVNAKPHIGYALEAVQTDAYVRYFKKIKGYDTFFSSGTDENAIKNVEAAEKAGVPTQEFVDKNAAAFLDLQAALSLSFDDFLRTSSKQHLAGAQAFWNLCKTNNPDDIYKKTYSGLYCTGCETFYKDGEFPDNVCPTHNRKLETVEEENYFFALSNYSKKIQELIESDIIKILPAFRKQEILNFIEGGIEDISISRPKERTKGWGIPVPDDSFQHIYVWFDALINYITVLGFPGGKLFTDYWVNNNNKNHVIGKDIVKFHALYWPAMLLSAKLPIPNSLFVHGFITVGGKKMSKTTGNVVDPFQLVSQYGPDAVRYYLLSEIPSLDDGDFSHERMQQLYTTDLANELGNSVLRLTTLAETDGIIMEDSPIDEVERDRFLTLYNEFAFDRICDEIWTDVKNLNREIDEFAPWKKTAEERKDFLIEKLSKLKIISYHLQPIMPQTAEKIKNATSGTIKKVPPLFPRP